MRKTLFLILSAALMAGLSGCSNTTTESAADPTEARTVRVTRARMEQTVRARGIVKPAPNALVRIGFPMPKDVSRRISRLTVVEGNAVKAGEILAELDYDDLKASLAQLRADAAVAERGLEALRALEPHDVAVAEAALAEAAAQLELAQRNMERLESLFRQSIAPRQAYDSAVNDLAVAQAQHRTADTRLQNTKAKYRTDIATAEAKLALARAALENIEVQIRWSVLRSPIDGQVFAVHQRQGELTSSQPQSPVATLLDPRGLQLHLYVDESDSGRVEPGRKVSFRLDAHADKTLTGTIARILPQPILQENVVYYLAVVEVNPEQRSLLRPEMTALGYIELGAREGVLRVPITAVKSRSDGWYATRIESGGAVETRVEVGWKDETGVEILAGLEEGDEILLNP
jgi:HlyD family secretion protein/macrolide-specific efflux system membrane fusion protein